MDGDTVESPSLRGDGLCRALDAWSREACRLRALAAERCVAIDNDLLLYGDVRDLQAYRIKLQRRSGHREPTLTWPFPWWRAHS